MHTNPEVLALLALGEDVGTPEDHQHVRECTVCSKELASLRRVVDGARHGSEDTVVTRPPDQVWDRICTELGLSSVSAAAEAAPAAEAPPNVASLEAASKRRRRRLAGPAVAAALALIAGVAIGLAADRWLGPSEAVIARAQLDPLPDWLGAGGTATLERDTSGKRYLVVFLTFPRRPDGLQQVWLLDLSSKGMQPLGFLVGPEGRFEVPPELDVAEFPVVDVSEEPANDGNSAHSGRSIVRGALHR